MWIQTSEQYSTSAAKLQARLQQVEAERDGLEHAHKRDVSHLEAKLREKDAIIERLNAGKADSLSDLKRMLASRESDLDTARAAQSKSLSRIVELEQINAQLLAAKESQVCCPSILFCSRSFSL